MDRNEAQARIAAATKFLLANGHTRAEVSRLLDGLYRDDAVEVIELRVKWIKRGSPQAHEGGL
jgi:hypothetical protein